MSNLLSSSRSTPEFLCSCLCQVMENVTVVSANAMLGILETTATAPQKCPSASLRMGRCAVDEEAVFVAAVSAQSQELLEIPVKNVPPALMPVALKGNKYNNSSFFYKTNHSWTQMWCGCMRFVKEKWRWLGDLN